MKIVVCIKPVNSDLLSNSQQNLKYFMNPYDLNALKNCISLKQRLKECDIVCLCMGSMEVLPVLLLALSMGADQGILLCDKKFEDSDIAATSYILSQGLKKIESVDMIVCGEKSIDGELGEVVYGISEYLELFCFPKVERFFNISEGSILLEKRNKKMRLKVKLNLPAVISYRKPLFLNIHMDQLKIPIKEFQKIKIWDGKDIEIDESKCGKDCNRVYIRTLNKV